MASSICVKCGQNTFELKEQQPKNALYVFNYLQCATCGTVAGLVEQTNTGDNIVRLSSQIGALAQEMKERLSRIDAALATIASKI